MPASKSASRKRPPRKDPKKQLPAAGDWRTTDEDEILKRQVRAREESFRIECLDPSEPVFSNFEVQSESGMTYRAEVRDIVSRQFSCTCTDFRINGLGTCKHIEAILLRLARQHRAEFKAARRTPSHRIDLVVDRAAERLRVERNLEMLPARLRAYFDGEGHAIDGSAPEDLLAELSKAPAKFRISQEVEPWLASRAGERERIALRRDYELGVQEGRYPEHVTTSPLFPYQREGMLHLAFRERALLADEMGLGKTIQAIAACALLRQLGKAERVLVVTPASLKSEWEEQIRKFTPLSLQLIFGGRVARTRLYAQGEQPFFTIVNYEQILADALDINRHLRPDIIVLDEAQRIKNWSTKTAQAVKRLESRYAFVLTGTPIENRIDELRSLVDFLDPSLLGPLFRFNREYYELDERGKPSGYRNLDRLRERVRPLLLRRRKSDVETELPDRTDRNHFVQLTKLMWDDYGSYASIVQRLVNISQRRPLTAQEQDRLMIALNCMRMICDSPGLIKDNPSRDCPKLDELVGILDELLADADVKVIIFSEWVGMLERVREWADRQALGYAWHTGSVPQQRRRAEINSFRNDPACRLFLSTDSGGVGLNLQNASVVINCDLPWNPAKLEQRIARAWRKGQRRPVTVINLIAERTIEHGMLDSLDQKSRLAAGLLDDGEISDIKLKRGREALLKRLEQVMSKAPTPDASRPQQAPPADPSAVFALQLRERLGERLSHCEETWLPGSDAPILLTVLRNVDGDTARAAIDEIFESIPWPGAKPTLQVMNTAAWASLQELAAAGMITIHSRARRPLLPDETDPAKPSLTPEQIAEITSLRETAEKKRRAAAALETAGLPDEAVPMHEAAKEAEARASSIESGTVG